MRIPTLSTNHPDTPDAPIAQGDVIESIMGLYRHREDGGFLRLCTHRSQRQIEALFHQINMLGNMIDSIWSMCLHLVLDKRLHSVPFLTNAILPQEERFYLTDSTLHMAKLFNDFTSAVVDRGAYQDCIRVAPARARPPIDLD